LVGPTPIKRKVMSKFILREIGREGGEGFFFFFFFFSPFVREESGVGLWEVLIPPTSFFVEGRRGGGVAGWGVSPSSFLGEEEGGLLLLPFFPEGRVREPEQ